MLKRLILQYCSDYIFNKGSKRQNKLRSWAGSNPQAIEYARFRAAVEKHRSGWQDWPARMKNGILREGDYNPRIEKYHLYVQWLADEQLQNLVKNFPKETGLYLDLPLGVHSSGYDVWREQETFCLKADCGAPPDYFFHQGQNWGFPPLHPEIIRQKSYNYFRACLHHNMKYARTLRLDHVMGLHRLFWIPKGFSAKQGAYVNYNSREFYAVLSLESHRHKTSIVGEDLGTVPRYVRPAMYRHGISRMYILSAEFKPNSLSALRPVSQNTLASLNTHDMPPFASFWLKLKEKERRALSSFLTRNGFLDNAKKYTEKTEEILAACLEFLASSKAETLLVNLEDLWLERRPQNVPGQDKNYPNWQSKSRYHLETFSKMPAVLDILKKINSLRQKTNMSI